MKFLLVAIDVCKGRAEKIHLLGGSQATFAQRVEGFAVIDGHQSQQMFRVILDVASPRITQAKCRSAMRVPDKKIFKVNNRSPDMRPERD